MEKEPKPENRPEELAALDKEIAEFYKQLDEKSVSELQEAMHINRAVELCVKYIDDGLLSMDMSLIEALEKLEKKKFELIDMDPEEAEGGREEN